MTSDMPIRDHMWHEPGAYDGIDAGVRFAVKVLHAAGIETCQSCQGGPGHSYPEPSVEMVAGADESRGFAALAALRAYGLPVCEVCISWRIGYDGHPFEKNWRIVFSRTMEDRADEMPMFICCYRHKAA